MENSSGWGRWPDWWGRVHGRPLKGKWIDRIIKWESSGSYCPWPKSTEIEWACDHRAVGEQPSLWTARSGDCCWNIWRDWSVRQLWIGMWVGWNVHTTTQGIKVKGWQKSLWVEKSLKKNKHNKTKTKHQSGPMPGSLGPQCWFPTEQPCGQTPPIHFTFYYPELLQRWDWSGVYMPLYTAMSGTA